jgi:Ribonuclease III
MGRNQQGQMRTTHEKKHLADILTDGGLAQFGDALMNFAFSLALTKILGQPKGTKIPDKTLADAAVKAGLRKFLPRRIGRGDVANSLEALLGHVWLQKLLTLDEIVECLKQESIDPSQNFVKLAELALDRLKL